MASRWWLLGADLFFDKSIEWEELIAFLSRREAAPGPMNTPRVAALVD